MSNLFYGWPKTHLAVITNHKGVSRTDLSLCDKIYQTGIDEEKYIFPFNFFVKKKMSGKIHLNKNSKQNSISISANESKKVIKLKRFGKKLLHVLSISFFYYRLSPSTRLLAWIQDFQPKIIYAQPSTLDSLIFLKKLESATGIPLVIHIMDDWPSSLARNCLLSFYWRKRIHHDFLSLLEKSKLNLSISDGMSEEFSKRYKKVFHAFHNPVDLSVWSEQSVKKPTPGESFKILYTGRIGTVTINSLRLLCKVIENLRNQKKIDLILKIYSLDASSLKSKEFSLYNFTTIYKNVPHTQIPQLLQSADLLFLPLDFDKKSISFARLSMPTKSSEFMISGTPVLVFASPETYLFRHAEKYNWGYRVGENCINSLQAAIEKLFYDEKLRKKVGQKSKELATLLFDSRIIRNKFHEMLRGVLKDNV